MPGQNGSNPYSKPFMNNSAFASESRFFDNEDRSPHASYLSPTTSSIGRGSPEPLIEANRSSGHRAHFLQTQDPSLGQRGAVEDVIRMRGEQAEFAPTQLYLSDNASSSGHGSTAHLLPSSTASSPVRRIGSTATGERPKTRYEDWEAGQAKVQTGKSSHTYDIMPDVALLAYDGPEKDDFLHDPGSRAPRFGPDRRIGEPGGAKASISFVSARGLLNAGALVIILGVLIGMFGAYPIITQVVQTTGEKASSLFTNSSGQVADIHGFRGLIDNDTPEAAYSRTGFDGNEYTLVFSDEFEQDGRTFYEGDDPYWTGVSLHYYATANLEYYDPAAAYTQGGSLIFNMTEQDPRYNHNFSYRSGMLQSWNQFCFTGGYIEVAVNLPGRPDVRGFWPGAWTMGNLGRAGYGATNEGTWPYSYDACDIGTLKNQTDPTTGGPEAVHYSAYGDNGLSYLPGQKLSACTCKGEDHPGPWLSKEKRFKGRAAPEIDILECTVEDRDGEWVGTASMSAQYAPYDEKYNWHNVSDEDFMVWPDNYQSELNAYKGNVWQESVSGLPHTDQHSYERVNASSFNTYGFEYLPSQYGNSSGETAYITWQQGGERIWQLKEPGMRANAGTLVSQRLISDEPMYMILNFGMSYNFGAPMFDKLHFPAIMKVEYVRVYQRKDRINVGCDPPGYPTAAYIDRHIEAYTDNNLTTWEAYTDAGFPKNKLIDNC